MNNFKKTSVLLSGVLVVFLLISFDSVSQNVKTKKKVSVNSAIRDSSLALKNLRVELKKHESTIRWLNQQNFAQSHKLNKLKFQSDSIRIASANLSQIDSSTFEFKLKETELIILAAQLQERIMYFMQEKVALNKKITDANAKSEYLLRREKSLSEYLSKFNTK
ncbi:MAG: hypothetical protein RL687_15 [Candidatus Parcubacteria bacterium]|jgi:hypothetical protein